MKYSKDDILKSAHRQKHWAMDALDEYYSALERAKREKKKGLTFCYQDSLREAKVCLYWARRRKKLSEKYLNLLSDK